jgi:8-amino-7-oxononanoate synthase
VSEWTQWAQTELAALRAAGRERRCTIFDGAGPRATVNGRAVVSFASNDYFGLAHHPRVRAAAQAAIERWGTSASASRLVTGTRPLHVQLEEQLARSYAVERTLLFPTGFAANLGLIAAFGGADVTVFSDALNHASIIDGCRVAKVRTIVYRHLDADHLQALLQETAGRRIVVTETVFSMDGDVAPVERIAALAARHRALLVIDEAHAALGPHPKLDFDGLDVLRVGTLSKTLAAVGGWVGGPRALIELLLNRARSFIFTTALTPADTAAALTALEICNSAEGHELRARLRRLVNQVRRNHPSPIIPVVIGTEEAATAAAAALFERGIHVPAIRPPTVPVGTSRLRITLSAAHDDAMVQQLLAALTSAGVSL